jgi:hypothetical protein
MSTMSWFRIRWPAWVRTRAQAPPFALSAADPFAGLAQIAERLDAMRTEPVLTPDALAARLEALELDARRCYRDATRRYLSGLRTHSAEALAGWSATVEACLVRLAHAHQSLLVPWSSARHKVRLAPEAVAPVLARGARACAAILKWGYLRGIPARDGVWADLCRLYAMAEGRGCARTPIPGAPGIDPRSSVEREFLKACMLWAGRPAALVAEQVDVAERVVEFCTPGFSLSSAADPRFAHVVDIEGGDPPQLRAAGCALAPSVRSIGLDGGERLLGTLLRLVHTDRIPPRAFGTDLEKALVLDTLRHLESCWAAPLQGQPGAQPAAQSELGPARPGGSMRAPYPPDVRFARMLHAGR